MYDGSSESRYSLNQYGPNRLSSYGSYAPSKQRQLYAMSAVLPIETGLVVVTDEPSINIGSLESLLDSYGVKEKYKKNVRDSAESINFLSDIINGLRSDGRLSSLQNYLRSVGYTPKEPTFKEAGGLEAVAYTDTYNRIGVNNQFKKAIMCIVKESGLSQKDAQMYVVMHEYVHLAQPHRVKSGVIRAESDADSRLAAYFCKCSEEASSEAEKKQYKRLAEYASSRVKGVISGKYEYYNQKAKRSGQALVAKNDASEKRGGSKKKSKSSKER
jgi:phosphoenolpyruvate carboxylase